jgi:Uma2 family endonuclease
MVDLLQKLDTSAFYEGDQNMVEHARQHFLVSYLESVLRWLYYKENWFVVGNIEIVNDKISHPISPDVMFFKGIILTEAEIDDLSSWRIELPHRPPPSVIFEICSKGTWKEDVEQKPEIYRLLGAKEYFAFDPKTYWGKKKTTRLKGWDYSEGEATEMKMDEAGRLWSKELKSFLKADGSYLRLYDENGVLRLTLAEGLLEEAQEEIEEAKLAEQRAVEEARLAEQRALDILAKLREKGINPEDLGL